MILLQNLQAHSQVYIIGKLLNLEKTVIIYASTWATFKPKLKKIKKSAPKKLLIFQEMELSSPKNLIKIFCTPNETSLGETRCLSNLCCLLVAQVFSF